MTFAHEVRQWGRIICTPAGLPIGVVCGFESDCEGRFAFIDVGDRKVLAPVKWVCPICKAERETGANHCKLCGAYLKVVMDVGK